MSGRLTSAVRGVAVWALRARLAGEDKLVRLRHRYPASSTLAALAGHWLFVIPRWRPHDLLRVAELPGGVRLAITLDDGWERGILLPGRV